MIGKTVSHYKIVAELGRGGMGEVYLAEDTKLKRQVSLKFLPKDMTRDLEFKERFKLEAQAAAGLNHPNIITIYEINEYRDQTYIAMEYVEGRTLREMINEGIQNSIPFPVDQAVGIVIQVAEGLAKAHQKGIIHRDIKPANIMVTQDGAAKILDFGLAKLKGQVRLTRTGMTLGTVTHMAPEQAVGKEVDQRADIWSLAVVLYEMLTGQLPFKGDFPQTVIYSILNEEPPPPRSLRPDIPLHIEALILRAFAKEPQQRQANMEELIRELQASPRESETRMEEKSIIILPFENLSPDKDNEYFSDGLTGEIINGLAKIHSLRVISRTSAMTFRGTKKKMKEIAREVNVQYVLEGSVRRAGNNIRITAQLIDAANDASLWAEKFNGTLDDVFDIQEKVSHQMVEALKLTLTPEEEKRIAERPIDNLAAYECYLRANQEIWRFSEDALDRALGYLQKGVDIAGDNALLYSTMAFACFQYVNIGVRQEEYIARAEAFVKKAMTLDPDFSKAHAVIGLIRLAFQGDLRGAVGHLKKALAHNPDDPDVLMSLVFAYVQYAGKIAAAVPLVQRLIQVDPLNPVGFLMQGMLHFYDGRFEAAAQSLQKTMHMDPGNFGAQMSLAGILVYRKRTEEAVALIDHVMEASPQNPVIYKGGLMMKHALMGEKEKALSLATPDWEKTSRRDADYSYKAAILMSLLNEKRQALDWLENAVNRGFINYPFLANHEPLLENIRGEERFQKLLERVKYEWEHFEA